MNISSLVANQVFVMLILILIGLILTKCNIISRIGAKNMTDILLNVVTPSVLIKAYQIDFDVKIAYDIATAFGLAVLTHIVFILLSKIVFSGVRDEAKRKVLRFTSIYTNCGFMGIPLLAATLGDSGVLLGSTYLASFNIIVWTHGLFLTSGNANVISLKNLVKNPGVIGTLTALFLFFANIRLTGVLSDTVGHLAGLNTALAMMLLGNYLAKTNVFQSLKNSGIYFVSSIRLLVFPLAALAIFKLLNVEYSMAISLMLPAACPCAAIAAMFAERFDLDTGYPSQIVSITTLFSLATLPLIAYITSLVFGVV